MAHHGTGTESYFIINVDMLFTVDSFALALIFENRAQKMTRLTMCLPHELKDLSSVPMSQQKQNKTKQNKELGMWACT